MEGSREGAKSWRESAEDSRGKAGEGRTEEKAPSLSAAALTPFAAHPTPSNELCTGQGMLGTSQGPECAL